MPVTVTSKRSGTLGDIPSPTTEIVGYARVSTDEQSLDLQLDALKAAGCDRVYQDVGSGTLVDRPDLALALDHLRAGDTGCGCSTAR